MIVTAALLFSLSCPNTDIINRTNTWNEFDKKTMERAAMVCKTRYGKKNKPCLIRFYKLAQRSYGAICGYKRHMTE